MSSTSSDGQTMAPLVCCGVGGGIAGYKAADLVSRLVRGGLRVQVMMTPDAQRFVAPLTFQALTNRPVQCRLFPEPGEGGKEALFPHLFPASEADAMLVLPATAGLLARLALGWAGDTVCAAALALPAGCLRFICPAMHPNMWAQATVQRNLRRLQEQGWHTIGPEEGPLACGGYGPGRMAEPETIFGTLREALSVRRALVGRRVLILSGPTHEYLDAVRYLGNRSSGRMGCALAEAALARGAQVDFVTGPVEEALLPRGPGLRIHRVTGCAEMLAVAKPLFPQADLAIFAAAVADYAPARRASGKRPRAREGLRLELRGTPDISETLCRRKASRQVVVGFALESGRGEARARRKLTAKHLDAILLNGPEAMGAGEAEYRFIQADPEAGEPWGRLTKRACAGRLLQWAGDRLGGRKTAGG